MVGNRMCEDGQGCVLRIGSGVCESSTALCEGGQWRV